LRVTLFGGAKCRTKTALPSADHQIEHNIFNFKIINNYFFLNKFSKSSIKQSFLAELIGGHRVFGHSMLWASVLTLITPFAAKMGYVTMIILRVLLGFTLGASWPAIHPMCSVWIKPLDRSKFISNMMASALGGEAQKKKKFFFFIIFFFII